MTNVRDVEDQGGDIQVYQGQTQIYREAEKKYEPCYYNRKFLGFCLFLSAVSIIGLSIGLGFICKNHYDTRCKLDYDCEVTCLVQARFSPEKYLMVGCTSSVVSAGSRVILRTDQNLNEFLHRYIDIYINRDTDSCSCDSLHTNEVIDGYLKEDVSERDSFIAIVVFVSLGLLFCIGSLVALICVYYNGK